MGLFGLPSLVAGQGRKGIIVGKGVGASLFILRRSLSREFVIRVLASCFIPATSVWYFLNKWLADYEYRTSIAWWIFVRCGLGGLSITQLTVSIRSIRAALANPVSSLSSE
jgi:putative ABC transport system permease protein